MGIIVTKRLGPVRALLQRTSHRNHQSIKGLRERQVPHSIEDLDKGMTVSVWNSLEDLPAYERSVLRQTLAKEVEHLYREEFWVKHFGVRATARNSTITPIRR